MSQLTTQRGHHDTPAVETSRLAMTNLRGHESVRRGGLSEQ